MLSDGERREKLLAFAEKKLFPFQIKQKADGSEEIIPDLCPFCHGGSHGDKHSFALSITYGVYVCKRGSCGARGRFETLCEHFGESCEDDFRRSSSEEPRQRQYVLPDTLLLDPTDEVYAYFASRKISKETVDAFKISSDPDGNIVFPFFENGTCVFEKFRRPEKPKKDEAKRKEWRSPGTKPILFGMDECVFSRPLIITEGQIDTLSLYEAGVSNCVSVPSGCSDLSWIENCWDWLERFHNIVLFGDNDEPGQKMVREVARRLDETRCMIVENYPNRPGTSVPCKDANEILYFYGGMKLIQMVEEAKEAPIRGLINLGSVSPKMSDDTEKILTMIPSLDNAIRGLRMGAVTVWSGKAGHGKSTLSGLLELQAVEQNFNVCVYSGELTKEEYQDWLNCQCAGSEYIGFKRSKEGDSMVTLSLDVQRELSAYYNNRIWLYDNQEIFEEDESETILQLFKAAYRRHECRLFVVDNLMMALADSNDELRDQKRFVNKLKRFARKYNVHVMVVAHPRKTGKDQTLDNQDIGGSMAIGALADATMIMERPNIRIVKNRITGKMPLISCVYCPDSRRIYEMDAGDKNIFHWNKSGISPLPMEKRASSLPEFEIQLPVSVPF